MPLAPPKKNDQVFQLSLTELAFTLVFLLLLLSGWIVVAQKYEYAKREKEHQQFIDQAKQMKQEAEDALAEISKLLAGKVANPEEVISDLRRCSAKEIENSKLLTRVAEQEAKLTALVAVQELLNAEGDNAYKAEVENAMAFKRAYEEALGKKLSPEEIVKHAKECASSAAILDVLAKENQNLRGQVTFMSKQETAAKGKKGFGLPPCWVDSDGRAQRLFAIEVTERGLIVRPGWVPERNDDAKSLPNIDTILATTGEQTIQKFRDGVMPIFLWSQRKDPECRHYASIGVSAASVNASVAGSNAVNDYFYPYGKVSIVKN